MTIDETVYAVIDDELKNTEIYWIKDIARRVIAVYEDACTPRPPQPEWFGTGPGQWDTWLVEFVPSYRHRPTILHECFQCEGILHSKSFGCDLKEIKHCVPVAREGFPLQVDWHVVGG